MSVCEFFANYVCSICCLNKRYREKLTKEGKDSFTLLNLPKTAVRNIEKIMWLRFHLGEKTEEYNE